MTAQDLNILPLRFIIILVINFLICSGILVLLILRNKIIHVALSLSKLHLIHTLTCIPVQESLSPEHGSELFTYPSEHLLSMMLTTRSGQLQSTEADIIEGLIVKNHALISVLNQLVDRKSCIIGFDDCIGNLRGREDREGLMESEK
ncbi:hypothetical protein M5K25_002588 [Dendrobium thyrsiflorum]|uniref:Uncharacterized protein n=1 Tax=Dendrobium thyrsiflorum TaxID=117978 RepID=A0ABD0VUB6_DENTH